MSNTQTLPSYMPNDYNLIKETRDDGTILFKHPAGKEIPTTDTDLYSFLSSWVGRLQNLVDMTDDDQYEKFGNICEIILQNAHIELQEAFSFIKQSIGHIRIETISRGEWCYRTGRVVGVSVKPGKGVAS